MALVAIVAAALAAAPGAFASMSILDGIENSTNSGQTAGGKLSENPGALAVNDSGAGGVGAGDFYLADGGNNRIQRFDKDGNFIEAWGYDVTSTGAGNGNAVQSVTVDASSGQFKLTFGADTTADLAYNATAAQVQSALQGLAGIGAGNVTVTGGPGGAGGAVPYGVVFTGTLAGTAQSAIVAGNGTTPLSGGAATVKVRTINAGGVTNGFEYCRIAANCKAGLATAAPGGSLSNPFGIVVQRTTGNLFVANKGFNRIDVFTATGTFIRSFGVDVIGSGKPGDLPAQTAVQQLTVKGTGGTFKLSFQGKTTGDIKFDASAAEVRAALGALSTITAGGVTVSGGPGDEAGTTPYLVTFAGPMVNSAQPNLGVTSSLSGSGAGAVVTTTQPGRNGAEICTEPADCKSGVADGSGGSLNGAGQLTIAPAGAPNAGNVLVPEENGNRVSEFTAAGEFVRAFGFGVAKFGPGKTAGKGTAVQTVKVVGSSGTFKLSFEFQSTASLPFNASAGEVQAALNGLSSVQGVGGSVSVTGGPGDGTGSSPYVVTFGDALAGKSVGTISLDATALGIPVGTALSCTPNPATAETRIVKWLRNGVPIEGANALTYTTVVADEGKAIQCQAIAINPNAGATSVSVQAYIVSPAPTSPLLPRAPESIAQPTQTGNMDGSTTRTLGCNPGTGWGNGVDTYTIQWYRNGAAYGAPSTQATTTASTIAVPASDQLPSANFQCMVRATNASGSTAKVSGNRTTVPAPAAPATPNAFAVMPDFSSVTTTTVGAAGFENCIAASFDVCQNGTPQGFGATPEAGQLTKPTRIAADAAGKIYTIEANNPVFRMQKFTLAGNLVSAGGDYAPNPIKSISGEVRAGNVAIGADGHVLVTQMLAKDTLPLCVEPFSDPDTVIYEFDSSETLLDTHLECSHNSGGGFVGFVLPAGSRSLAVNQATGRTYFIPSKAVIYVIDEPLGPGVEFGEPSDVRATSATFPATIEPAPGKWSTYYHVEVREVGDNTWQRSPAVRGDDPVLGNGSGSGPPSACPTGNPPICDVSITASGLKPETEYESRLAVYTWGGPSNMVGSVYGQTKMVPGETFVTVPSAPTSTTGAARWSSPAATGPSLLLKGQINAANRRTTFVFEYVADEQFNASGWGGAAVVPKAPARPVEAGKDFVNVNVRQNVTGLDPSKTYHYRLVATNANGVDYGQGETVEPPENGVRYLERVSNGDGEGMAVSTFAGQHILGVSPDGNRAYFQSQSMNEPRSLAGLQIPFGADRTAEGWKVFDVGADPAYAHGGYVPGEFFVAGDLSGALWVTTDRYSSLLRSPIFSFSSADGGVEQLFQAHATNPRPAEVSEQSWGVPGGSPDFSTIIFFNSFNTVSFVPGEIGPSKSGLYMITGARSGDPKIDLVARDSAGVQIGAPCDVQLGSRRGNVSGETTERFAVSDDASSIYFTVSPTPNAASKCDEVTYPKRLYKRVVGEETVEVSAPQCPGPCGGPDGPDIYKGASRDGSKVVFKTVRRLVAADQDSTADVYLYDSDPPAGKPKLVQISAGIATASHPNPGTDAKVDGVLSISADGSRVAFIASGALTSDGVDTAKNVYVYQRDAAHPDGLLKRVASVSGPSAAELTNNNGPSWQFPMTKVDGHWGDGRFLFFQTPDKLVGADTDTQIDLYRWDSDAGSEALQCITCAGNGAFPIEVKRNHAGINFPETEANIASADGQVVVFWTREGLVNEDTNGALDVYAWDHGDLELITPEPIQDATALPQAGTTPDGSVIWFLTASSLVPDDPNSAVDLYAARIDGGFPAVTDSTFVTCLSAAECKAKGVEVAASPSPGSLSFVGPDNPAPGAPEGCKKGLVRKHGKCIKPAPKKCKKGQVRKGKKCVKKGSAKQKHGKASRAAGHDRRSSK